MSIKIAAIMLAAGRSSRLGRPKQLVTFQGKTLLRHSVQSAIFSPADSVTVVLGAFFPLLRQDISLLDATIVKNRNWARGMGSSLKAGLRHVLAREVQPNDGFLFLTCDQPFVDETLLENLCTAFTSRKQIIASSYAGAVGVPAVFGRDYLGDLLELDDDQGARYLLERQRAVVQRIAFKDGGFDVDTAHDLDRLRHINQGWTNGQKRGTDGHFIQN